MAVESVSLTKVQKARGKFLLKDKFLGTLMLSAPLKEDPSCETAYTDMTMIGYNPKFFDQLTELIIIFVLAHEIMHIMLKHGLRKGNRHHVLWNVACDYAINWILKEMGFELWANCLVDAKYAGKSAEQIYDILMKEIEEKQKKKKKEQGQGQPQPGNGQPQPGQPGNQPGQPGGPPQPGTGGMGEDANGMPTHVPGTGADIREPGATKAGEAGHGDPAKIAEINRRITGAVAQAATMARMAGSLTGEMKRLVEGILEAKVPWQDVLFEYMNRVVQADESWAKRNRRFSHTYLPARHEVKIGGVVFIGDTSGSITNKELAKVGAEVVSCVASVSPEWIRLIWADTKVKGEQYFDNGEEVTFDPKGGGGTDMRVPLKHAEEYDADVVVLITDGHTPWPDREPDYPLIVLCTTNVNVPIGQVIRI